MTFSYDNSAFALSHISMKIAPGQKIAIVGQNGAGKSTLMKLLLRLYDVSDGEILFSGTQEEISNNMAVIQSRLENKYTERQNKLRDLIYNLVYPKACKFMSDYKLNFDNYNGSISFDGVGITWNDGSNGQVNLTFGFKQLIDDTLADLANKDQYNQNTIIQAIKKVPYAKSQSYSDTRKGPLCQIAVLFRQPKRHPNLHISFVLWKL